MKVTKIILITSILGLFGSDAFAYFKVFEGISEWNQDSFSPREYRGVEMDSIERALVNCRMDQMRFCVVKGTGLEMDRDDGNRRVLSTIAVVHGYESEPVGEIVPFSEKWRHANFSASLSPLQILSIKSAALNRALQACHKQFEFCAVLGVNITENNKLGKEEGSNKAFYYTSAEAKVVGIKSFLEPAIAVATVVSEAVAAPKE